jgi:phospholipid-translocating ATPase
LDGETDWKLRLAVPLLQALPSDDHLFQQQGLIYADRPHKDIYSFVGNFRCDTQGRTEPLSAENMLWMNTVLASGSAIGCVVYTGADTRAVLNTSQPSTKIGLLDLQLNRLAKVSIYGSITPITPAV